MLIADRIPFIAGLGRFAVGLFAALAPSLSSAELPLAAPDPVVARMVEEALQSRPELQQNRMNIEAERARVPQAGALPDPTLTLGIQNDGFKAIQIGTMETSYWQVMITQPFFWPGKRGLRSEVARLAVSGSEAALERARLSTEAEVRRGYVDLLRTRDALRLQSKLEVHWRQAEGLARARYQVAQTPQSDLLRAQLERTRLEQRRSALEADELLRVQELNRLRGHPLDEPIPTTAHLLDLPVPAPFSLDLALADAEARSPELAAARAAEHQSSVRADLARRERYPDFTVSAGIMPRGGFDPMWTASLGITLPVFSGRAHAVAESESRHQGGSAGIEAVRQILRLRTQERATQLGSLLRINQLYRSGLLVQSEAAVESTETQYQVGRVTFASVLEALNAYVADQQGSLDAAADALRIVIAQRELSLEPSGGGSAGGISGSVPGAGSAASAGAGASASGSSEAGAAPGGGMGKGM